MGDLPTRERSIFLKEVLRDDNPAVSEAAVWQAGILPRPARGALPRPARGALLDLALNGFRTLWIALGWYLRFGAVPSAVNARVLHPPVQSGQGPEVTPD